MRHTGKVVVITGASSGIGRATALEFARKGYTVVLGARREQALKALEEECKRLGGNALAFPLDVTYENDVKAMVQKTLTEFGHIDVWVNNAAVSLLGKFEETPTEDIRRVIDINLFGYIHGAKAIIPHFRERKQGTLINISSIVGITGQPYSSAYTISKFAVRGLSISLQQELSDEKNIHICSVLPGTIDTPLFQQAGNYMGREIQAPEPAMEAEKVADVIFRLTLNPRKEVTIGLPMGLPAFLLKTLTPGLVDNAMRKRTYNKHFSDEPAFPSRGNLYDPMREYASISGGWQHSEETTRRPGLAVAGAVTAGAALGAFFITRQALKRKDKYRNVKTLDDL
jgi:short-subunit dehydrogenase